MAGILDEETFSFTDVRMEPIPIDDDQEYAKYAVSMYERLVAVEKPTGQKVADEAIRSASEASILTYVPLDVQEASEEPFVFQRDDIDSFIKVKYTDMTFQIPVPKHDITAHWNDGILPYAEYVNRKTDELRDFGNELEINSELEKIEALIVSVSTKREGAVRTCFRNVARVILREKLLKTRLSQLAKFCGKQKACPDSISDGLWLIDEQRQKRPIARYTSMLSLRCSMRVDSKTATSMVDIVLSKSASARAKAKLDVAAKLTTQQLAAFYKSPTDVLALTFAEAHLTPEEVLPMIFPSRKDDAVHQCLHCGEAISLNYDAMYHRKCPSVEWLTRYQPFKYDDTDRCLVPITKTYIRPEVRHRLSELLDLHHRLNNDIVVKENGQTILWTRNRDGTLVRSQLRNVRPDEMVGTHAWRVKNGFSPRK